MKFTQILTAGILVMSAFGCDKEADMDVRPEGISEEILTRVSDDYTTLGSSFSRGFGINNAGVVTGSVEGPAGVIVAFTLSNQGIWYSDEPVAGDGLPVIRFSINDKGDVAGHKKVPGGITPVVWINGELHELAVLSGYQYGEVFDINASGLMVGESLNGNYVNPPDLRATVFNLDGEPVDIGTLGGSIASAVGVNDKGDIVGFAETTVPGQTRAFLYRDNEMVDLGTLGGFWSNANSINNKGEIVGRSVLADGVSIRGFYYYNGQMENIGTLGGNSSVAVDINDRGDIVGFSRISTGPFHAFLYRDGVMTDLGSLLPGTDSRAMSINNNGDVTGYYTRPDGTVHAFFWRNGEMLEL